MAEMEKFPISIRTIGEAAPWEYKFRGIPDGYSDGSLLWVAEVVRCGMNYTLYFDVTPEEAQDEEKVKQWIIDEWDWSKCE